MLQIYYYQLKGHFRKPHGWEYDISNSISHQGQTGHFKKQIEASKHAESDVKICGKFGNVWC